MKTRFYRFYQNKQLAHVESIFDMPQDEQKYVNYCNFYRKTNTTGLFNDLGVCLFKANLTPDRMAEAREIILDKRFKDNFKEGKIFTTDPATTSGRTYIIISIDIDTEKISWQDYNDANITGVWTKDYFDKLLLNNSLRPNY